MKLNFIAKQGSGSKRLYTAWKKYDNRSVASKNIQKNKVLRKLILYKKYNCHNKGSQPTRGQAACGTTSCYDDRHTGLLSQGVKKMLRDKLVEIALEWQARFGVSPQITSTVSEYDAAILVGMSEKEYSDYMKDKTAVSKGSDFAFNNIRYQVKANRPSGKPGSFVTMVPKATNYEWDKLIWILYDKNYVMQEAWEWDVEDYKSKFDKIKRLSPLDYRKGKCLFIKNK